jgi:hypothetical protein
MSAFRPELQVKQWVAEVQGQFCRWRVFRTGSDRHLLFDQLDTHGCSTGLQVPVLKADLQPAVRSMLARGRGNA